MVFLTGWFLQFLLVILPLYHFVVPRRLRKYFLLVASAVFHAHYAGPAGVLPIVGLGGLVYLSALPAVRRIFSAEIVLAMAVVVFALIYYKYTHFLAGLFGLDERFNIFVPLAISFFTFEFVHYLVEVRKGGAPILDPFDFWLFIVFFPTIASGPIKRYKSFGEQIRAISRDRIKGDAILHGVYRVSVGLFKKLVIAELCVSQIHAIEDWLGDPSLPRGYCVLLILLQTVRIYADFAGYSDIAIGLSRLFGITIPENFSFPYLASNLGEFWRRWHISLSSWIRDYVYIPLGGNRVSRPRKAFNGLAAMFLCGLWHGPALHFGVWGIYHGVGLAIQGRFGGWLAPEAEMARRLASVVNWLITLGFVSFGWLIFFYEWKDIAWISSRIFGLR